MSTTLIAIRHAKPSSDGYADEKMRPLHRDGISTQMEMTKILAEKGYCPDLIYSSPILRATQTAEIIAKHFSLEIIETESLGYSFDGQALMDMLPDPKKNQTIVLVGHAPHLGEFVNQLAGKTVLISGLCKSGTAVLTIDQPALKATANFIECITP